MFQTKRPPFFPPLPRPLDRLCVDEVEVRSIRNRISVTMQTERFWIRRFRMSIVDDGDHVQLIGWCCCRIRGDAEGMRLVRIRALAESDKVDKDIRNVFRKILPDEEFHEKAFGAMSDDEAIKYMQDKHEAGLDMLGLEI